jgi:hypothetical protein
MDADMYAARWTIIIRDDHDEHGTTHKMPPWKAALPPGAAFYIAKDAFGDYWYLPTPELKSPMNTRRKLTPSDEKHGEFEVGVLLPGCMCADLGGTDGKLFFSINLLDGGHRIINLSQSHGGSHGFG